MWILLSRPPRPDAAVWRGRKTWAAIDAVLWPGACLAGLLRIAPHAGVFVPVGVAMALMWAAHRLHVALFRNHRYRFTSLRLAKVFGVLLLVGAMQWAWQHGS